MQTISMVGSYDVKFVLSSCARINPRCVKFILAELIPQLLTEK